MNDSTNKKQIHVLNFVLQKINFCIELKYIKKVIELPTLEPVPGGPAYLAGLLNLAGKSIPIVDLALSLGLYRDKQYSINTSILICADKGAQIGIIADKIIGLEVIETDALQMHDEFDKEGSLFYAVVVNLNSELSLLIDIPRILMLNVMSELMQTRINDELIAMATVKSE